MVPEFPGGVMVKTSPSPSAPAPHKPALIQVVILRLAIELAEGFLADSDKPEPAKVLTIVRDPA